MEQRVKQLEHAVQQLQDENRQVRTELQQLREQLLDSNMYGTAAATGQRTSRSRWSVVVLAAALVAVPVLSYTVWHANAYWSTAFAALNTLVFYIVGPGVMRLLIEGLFRSIPGVVFGQAARVAVDNYRTRRRMQGKT